MPRLKMLRPRIAELALPLERARTGESRAGWKHDADRGSRHQRGYGREWEKRRLEVLTRDDHLCQQCKRAGRVRVAAQVDHLTNKAKARALGWTDEQMDDPSNLESICRDCHREKTQRESHESSST